MKKNTNQVVIEERLLTTIGAAEILGVTPRTIRGYAGTGGLTAYKKGRKLYFLYSDLIKYIMN